jgi:hypothetical protein
LENQPASFQVANYNLYPPPTLSFTGSLPAQQTVQVHLVDEQRAIVNGGFQTGDVQVLKMGQLTMQFTGLKLNKMTPIKNELKTRSNLSNSFTFSLLITIAGMEIYSPPFRLVSSCNQLSEEARRNVRPRTSTSHSKNSSSSFSPILIEPPHLKRPLSPDHLSTTTPPESALTPAAITVLPSDNQLPPLIPDSALTGPFREIEERMEEMRKELDIAIKRGDPVSAQRLAKILAEDGATRLRIILQSTNQDASRLDKRPKIEDST